MIQAAWTIKQSQLNVMEEKRNKFDFSATPVAVAFFCDESEEHADLAYPAYKALKRNNPQAAHYMATFATGDDKQFSVLQAADACVYEIRRILNLVFKQYRGEPRKQFRLLEESKRIFIISQLDESNLRHIVSRHQPGEPLKMDEIMEMTVNEDLKFVI